ncbi:aminodeoxychorismate synthase, component I [Halalkalibacillus sediminis]|uniref:Aminodeoxychorismate synthase, component I n=1 Tax=Halalkalibacillus sediminis TaxID=2018042 RepID=A0A2I0QSY4_9BACI|nr:aminodeoxychorismate synthase component I [Halalkalibacillus sediminis]PKR77230.1 aminodeoxychorismate synthase, component I [Halalkalibacillus sediminis]
MKTARLKYLFLHDFLEEGPLVFENPLNELVAHSVEEVPTVLEEAERQAQQGFYVAGYVTYEAAQAFYPDVPFHRLKELPYVWFGVFEGPSQTEKEVSRSDIGEIPRWKADISENEYKRRIADIHSEIKKGRTYQVNFTFRLKTILDELDRRSWFNQLVENQQANFAAHLELDEHEILSVSPELFFAWDGSNLETKPMKGTIKRGWTSEEDIELKEKLIDSEKDRAENVMIVDLLRNDMSRVAEAGTVNVSSLFNIETYPTVHQMTSTIHALTRKGTKLVDVFRALFPCGSITGAPKKSTMSIINNLETSPREVYCGAIGLLTPDGKAVFNVPIRTILFHKEKKEATYGVGGGITWDSSPGGEFEEAASKAEVLRRKAPTFELLETMLVEEGTIKCREEHLSRVLKSADYFQFDLSRNYLEDLFDQLEQDGETFKVRLLVSKKGHFTIEKHPYEVTEGKLEVSLANEPVSSEHLFLYHKTTNRLHYEERKLACVFDTILWNEEGKITEFTNGNLAYLLEGEWFTPPVTDGLLPGTYRESLIREGKISERSLTKDELEKVEQLVFINSVRGWMEVEMKPKG